MSNKKNEQRLPPQSIESELAVLGCILIEPQSFSKALHFINKDSFYKKAHSTIFIAMSELFNNSESIDSITLTDPLYDALDNGDIILLDIDVIGGTNVMEEFPDDTLSIFIEPPGLNIAEQKITLEDRLRNRGNDQTTQIKNRLKRFEKEMESKEYFDLHYINENLKETVSLIEKDIKKRV